MGRKVFSLIIFILLLWAGFTYLNKVFAIRHHYVNTINDFNELSKNTNIDVLFFGSSHAYTVYNPIIINNKSKTLSFNLGSASLKTTTSNLIFKEALKVTSPKLAILEFCDSAVKISQDSTLKTEKFQLRVLDEVPFYSFSKAKEIFKMYNSTEIIEAYSPLIRDHASWNKKEFFNLERRRFIEEDKYYFSSGFLGVKKTIEDEAEKDKYNDFKTIKTFENDQGYLLDDYNKTLLKEFIQLANEKNVKVLIIASPELRARHRNYKIYSQLETYAKELNVSFLNLNDYVSDINLNPNDFYDNQHVNLQGSVKVNTFLAEYINQNFNLPDRTKERIWKIQDSIFQKFKQDFILIKSSSFGKKISKPFTKDIVIDSLGLTKKSASLDFSIIFDKSKPYLKEIKKYNLLVKLYPNFNEESLINERSKSRGWNYDKIDVPLNNFIDTLTFKIPTRIRNVIKIEMLLYNKEKYEGTIGDKIFIENIHF